MFAVIMASALMLPGTARASIQHVQSNYYSPHSDQSTIPVTYDDPQLAGSLNVVIVAFNNSTSNVQSVTDTKGNTYTLAVGPTVLADFGKQYIYYAKNIVAAGGGQNTVTVVLDAVTPYPDVRIAEYSGINTSNPLDAGVGSTGTAIGLITNSGSLTTTNATDLLVAGNFVEFHTMEAGANYTGRVVSYDGHILEDRVVSSAGSYSATATVNEAGRWIMQLAAFKAAGGGGDTQAPTAPSNLNATAVSSTQIDLSWTASTDDVGVTGYLVERCQGSGCSNFSQIATPTASSYSDSDRSPSTSYTYRARAQDAVPNYSAYSTTASATTPAMAQSSLQIESLRYRIEQVAPVPDTPLTYDVTARAAISNSGTDAVGATARIIGSDPAATVFDGNVGFGDVPPIAPLDAVRSLDTFKLRIVITAPDDLQHAMQSAQTLIEGLSWQISCADCGGARAPIANAGPDQSVFENQTVTLDGSASTDPDGHLLQFSWSLLSAPTGAQPQVANASSVRPTIVLPVPGTYVVQLVVNDGSVSSAPATVTLSVWNTVTFSTGNSAPVANAGVDRTAPVGTTVKLAGGASTDVNGDRITYEWELIETPANSSTALANADPATPAADFAPDAAGRYVAQLVVHDAVSSSAPDTTIISTSNSAPVANAGTDARGQVGQGVPLDGGASWDPDGNAVNYQWSLVAAPAGSSTALSSTSEFFTTLTPDVPGIYVAQLVVNDGISQSEPDAVAVSTVNSRPVAILSASPTVGLNQIVTVHASSSFDPDGDAISYSWSIISTPVGSTTGLESNGGPTTQFIADMQGIYVLQVSVSDGTLDAAPTTAQIVVGVADHAPPVITIESPAPFTLTSVRTVTISGQVSEPANVYALSAAVPLDAENRFSFMADLFEGANWIQISAADAAGNSTYEYAIVILDSVPPAQPQGSQISVDPQSQDTLHVRGGSGAVEPESWVRITNLRTGESVTIRADGNGAFDAQIAGLESDAIRVAAIDEAQNESEPTDVPGIGGGDLSVQILAPAEGTVVADRFILVKGQLFGPTDASVSVNNQGVVLFEQAGVRSFSAQVALTDGANTIDVVAQRVNGNTVSQQLHITRSGSPSFSVTATPNTGTAPLDVMFEIAQFDSGEIAQVTIDLDGDGNIDATSEGDDRYIAAHYESPGLFEAQAAISTTAGVTVNATVPITVQTSNQVDKQIQRVWAAIGAALRAGDATGALSHFIPQLADRYAPAFQQPGVDLNVVADALGPITFGAAAGPLVNYVLVREVDGDDRAFLVTFVRGRDGAWRVAGL